jgi:beta-1,4-mannosyltransferase
VLFVITGRGPRKAHYEQRMQRLHSEGRLRRVRFATAWLAAEDYPLVLSAADCGVSLHVSSSGLDLPMKVVDMFGSGLPVCAVNFSWFVLCFSLVLICIHSIMCDPLPLCNACSLDELVVHDRNGQVFTTSEQLSQQLVRLLQDFQSPTGALATLRAGVAEWIRNGRWTANWTQNALPLFR